MFREHASTSDNGTGFLKHATLLHGLPMKKPLAPRETSIIAMSRDTEDKRDHGQMPHRQRHQKGRLADLRRSVRKSAAVRPSDRRLYRPVRHIPIKKAAPEICSWTTSPSPIQGSASSLSRSMQQGSITSTPTTGPAFIPSNSPSPSGSRAGESLSGWERV